MYGYHRIGLAAKLKAWGNGARVIALDVLFPPRCLCCSAETDAANGICANCFSANTFVSDPVCACCGNPFIAAMGEEAQCIPCLETPPLFAAARFAFVYDEASRPLVTRFKYADRTDRLPLYGSFLLRAGKALIEQSELIIPVPIHWRRLWIRKYNQAALLAGEIAKRSGLPVIANGLARTSYRPPQASLTREERLHNVKNAFCVNHRHAKKLMGASVLLVDDVMTTGATIQACAKLLRGAGAKEVRVLTLARTLGENA